MSKSKFGFSNFIKTAASAVIISVFAAFILLPHYTCKSDEMTFAVPTSSKIYIDGCEAYIQGYNIDNSNYFKLRDLSAVLSDTKCRFAVSYDESDDTISILAGEEGKSRYTQVDENPSVQPASYTRSRILFNGEEAAPLGYNINYNNYFKLRDIGELLGFSVEWNEAFDAVYITTDDRGNIDYNSYRDKVDYFDELNQVVYLVNSERANNGLPPLKWDLDITRAAARRAVETVELFSHTRPNGSSCFTVFDEFNIDYMTAGENIAIGHQTPESVVSGWMNSQGHRENILSSQYGKIGIGAVKVQNGPYRGFAWVQLFTD